MVLTSRHDIMGGRTPWAVSLFIFYVASPRLLGGSREGELAVMDTYG